MDISTNFISTARCCNSTSLMERNTFFFAFHGHQEPFFACQFKTIGLHKVSHLIIWTHPKLFFIGISFALKSRPGFPSLASDIQYFFMSLQVSTQLHLLAIPATSFCYFLHFIISKEQSSFVGQFSGSLITFFKVVIHSFGSGAFHHNISLQLQIIAWI